MFDIEPHYGATIGNIYDYANIGAMARFGFNLPRDYGPMRIEPTAIPDVLLVEPKVHGDARGFFFESYNRRALAAAGIDVEFVQDNHSRSRRGVRSGSSAPSRRSTKPPSCGSAPS